MAAAGKKKGKGKKVSLGEFLQKDDGSVPQMVGSWAEEVPDENFIDDNDMSYKTTAIIDRSQLPNAPRASRGPDVDLSRVPSVPPFTAYLGNIPFDCNEEDIEKFFGNLTVENVRIPSSMGRQKGFAYVEFKTREELLEALSLSNSTLKNREVKINLATESDAQSDRKPREYQEREEIDDSRTEGDWRRKEPGSDAGAARPNSAFARRGGFGRDGDSGREPFSRDSQGGSGGAFRNFERRDDRGGGGFQSQNNNEEFSRSDFGSRKVDRGGFGGDYGRRDDRGGFGRDDRGGGGYGRDDRGYGRRDDRNYGRDDRGGGYGRDFDRRDNQEFRREPYERDSRSSYDRPSSSRAYSRPNDSSDNRPEFSRNTERPRMDRPPSESSGGYPARRGSTEHGSQDGDSKEAPKERPRLKLQPRTKAVEPTVEVPDRSASIFGAAKPVDTAAKERAIEERLQHEKELEVKKLDDHRPPMREAPVRSDSYENQRPRRTSSSSSGKGYRTVVPPTTSSRSKRDSATSHTSQDEAVFEGNQNVNASRSDDAKVDDSSSPPVKLVPAPPPPVNIWEKRKQHLSSSGDAPTSPTEQPEAVKKEPLEVSRPKNTAPGGPPSKTAADTVTTPVAKPPVEKPKAWGGAGTGASIVSGGAAGEKRRPSNEAVPSQPASRGGGNAWARGAPGGRGGARGTGTGRGASTGTGRGAAEAKGSSKKHERASPKSVEEMPRFEEKKPKDFADGNKFAFLSAEDENLEE